MVDAKYVLMGFWFFYKTVQSPRDVIIKTQATALCGSWVFPFFLLRRMSTLFPIFVNGSLFVSIANSIRIEVFMSPRRVLSWDMSLLVLSRRLVMM